MICAEMPLGTSIHSHSVSKDRRKPCKETCGSPATASALMWAIRCSVKRPEAAEGLLNTHSFRRGRAFSNAAKYGGKGMTRHSSTLSRMVICRHWKSTSTQRSSAISSRRAPLISSACKYAAAPSLAVVSCHEKLDSTFPRRGDTNFR